MSGSLLSPSGQCRLGASTVDQREVRAHAGTHALGHGQRDGTGGKGDITTSKHTGHGSLAQLAEDFDERYRVAMMP